MKFAKNFFITIFFTFVFCTVNIPNEESIQNIEVFSRNNPDTVIPGGTTIGVTLSTDGVIVVGFSEITKADGKSICPARAAGIKQGDTIKTFNSQKISNVEDLCNAVEKSGTSSASIGILRNGKNIEMIISPGFSSSDKKPKIGAWVKDAASGIGTMTFYNPETKYFAALGHGICDSDSGDMLNIDGGEILSSTIVSVDKGERGSPGELNGIFSEKDNSLGIILYNSKCGIIGTVAENFTLNHHPPVSIAKKEDVCVGKAYILANVEGTLTEKFDIEITRILPAYAGNTKNMIIKITDERLIKKTGGIVQGMSGSPVIQNGKLVGAITHVFLNDPTRGYGIFIENMLEK